MRSHHVLSLRVAFGLLALSAVLVTGAWADPLPGEILKFQQLPLDGGVPLPGVPALGGSSTAQFPGHDELSTAYSTAANPNVWVGGVGTAPGGFMADDFADKFSTPVVHVRGLRWNAAPANAAALIRPKHMDLFR